MEQCKVSIITVVFNNKGTISSAIDSVLSQAYPGIEYIIIDGGSTDGTDKVVKSYGGKITTFISEPDKGLYDAMNKGIKLATGDVIGILNSDDLYYNNNVIQKVADEFRLADPDAVYGDLLYVDKSDTNKNVRYWKSSDYQKNAFVCGWHPPHPTFFVKRDVYEKYGLFDISFDLSADFELMLRFIEKFGIKTKYIPEILVKMRLGGETNKSIKNIIKGNVNCIKAFRKNGIRPNYLYPLFRLLPKLNQYILARFRGRSGQSGTRTIRGK